MDVGRGGGGGGDGGAELDLNNLTTRTSINKRFQKAVKFKAMHKSTYRHAKLECNVV